MAKTKQTKPDEYLNLEGNSISLRNLTGAERKLLDELERRAKQHPDWNDFSNFWIPKVADLYRGSGLSRREITRQPVFRIAQDIGSQLAVAAGLARVPDYRDDLELLIATKFHSRREFCEASGLSEDMVSHVLAKRKHLAINTLADALQRIGYRLHIAQTT